VSPVYKLSYSRNTETQSIRKDINNSLVREKIRAVIITETTTVNGVGKLRAKFICQANR